MNHELDPATGRLKTALTNTGDPRCHCPKACSFHGTSYHPHDTSGSKAALRRQRQLLKVPFTCPDCTRTFEGHHRHVIGPDTVVCGECFEERKPKTTATKDFEMRELADGE